MTTSARRSATFLLRQPRQVPGFREVLRSHQSLSIGSRLSDGLLLSDEVALTMLWIPPGRFWMGSPDQEPERESDEGPQHLVQLQGFFMGQMPITQAQWRAVMGSNPSILNPSPSSDSEPVTNVSWNDAMEFCRRMHQRTDRSYTLPSEAQWEYACRAGTSTPFHCGKTITPELANYDGTYTYGDGPKGEFRQRTTPGGKFPANAWGLQDMHGNIWEWCLDNWHRNYQGLLVDGSAWLDSSESEIDDLNQKDRVLRGGSWSHPPRSSRSAFRFHSLPDLAFDDVGFRVACLPQGPSLNS